MQQFNSLPKDLRRQVSSASAMDAISGLEKKYQVDLAMIVMKVMTKSLPLGDLPAYLNSEFSLAPEAALALTRELKEQVFASVSEYLGFKAEVRAWDLDKDISLLVKEAGLVLASEALLARLKSVLSTYLRGVRSKIDAKAALAKDVSLGGLGLQAAEIERVFKVCDSHKFRSLDIKAAPAPISRPPLSSSLDKMIDREEKKAAPLAEYNLKAAIASGQVKRPEVAKPLDLSHELPQPEIPLDLPAPAVKLPDKPVQVAPVAPVQPIPAPVPVKPQILKDQAQPEIKPVPKPVAPAPKPSPANRPASQSSRPQLHDIRPMPKVMGPVEELQFLDLVNFRRLGKSPAEISAKLLAKIKLLEREGYDKLIAGVKAWRQSPVNRLYLRLGQEAAAKGISLKQAIEARQKSNQEYLSWEEIEAIVVLNSQLVF